MRESFSFLTRKVESKKKIKIFIETDEEIKKIIAEHEEFIKKGAGVSLIKYNDILIGGFAQRVIAGHIIIKIPLEGLIDTKKEKEKAEKEIANIEKFVKSLKSRLKDKAFVSKAPKQIIDQQKETLDKKEAELAELKKHLQTLK